MTKKRPQRRRPAAQPKPADALSESAVIDMEAYAACTVGAALAGDTKAAREILSDFVGAIDQYNERTWRGPVQWAYARYLADALQNILNSDADNAGVALGIKSSEPGRRKGQTKYNTEALAAGYYLLIRAGLTPKSTKLHIREKIGASRDVVEASISENEAFAHPQLIDDEILKAVLRPYAAEIAAIFAAEKLPRR